MKLTKSLAAAIVTSLSLTSFSAFADDSYNSRPDAHAPIGIMRDHVHKEGEYMLSYRYDYMNMKGNRNGTNNLSTADVLSDYMMSPSKMSMKMHMVGAMYGVNDKLTLMAMGNFMTNSMKMIDGMNNDQTTSQNISGFGDTTLNAMYGFFKDSNSHAQFNLGVSLPTGSIKRNDQGSRLPYAMQLGSGSYELLPGLSYTGFQDSYSYGAQTNGQFRLNYNNSGYKLGDSYNATLWTAKKLNEAFSVSSRLNYTITQKTKGYSEALNTEHHLMMSPTNNSTYSGGRRLDFLLGVNFIVPSGALKGHRLALEGGVPLYQKLNGTQMSNNYNITLGWQKSF